MGRLAILILTMFWGIVTLGSLVWEVLDPASISTDSRPQALPPSLTGKADTEMVPATAAAAPADASEPTLAELSPGLRASLRATVGEQDASNPRRAATDATLGTAGDAAAAPAGQTAAPPPVVAPMMRPRPRPAGLMTADATPTATAKTSLGAIKPPIARPSTTKSTASVAKAPDGQLRAGAPRGNARVAEAQELLAALGYPIGVLDGRLGPQTQAAVKAYEKRGGLKADGRVDEQMLARLRADAAALSRDEAVAATPGSAPVPSRSLTGRVLGNVQRLIGHDFNSVTAPEAVNAYCDEHGDEWIYDRGVDRLRACAELVGKPKVAFRPLPGDR
ncbi:peptidoglycan-binding domain-containing protein [Defluviicoccus vanus]|uniref:Peptidoglycan-binding protein n=1 Tax=Defluviicoccus vanus TaxID=111831 RepID=A0A7H1MYX4_9PROT|nr:peptidoglycan-binding domain-containing protein [Defluviicoccus vanus]QNT68660.1 peptidoglycan-binding protein [Defluviicoccus vanus]